MKIQYSEYRGNCSTILENYQKIDRQNLAPSLENNMAL